MSVQINVQASQSALAQSISQGVAAYNARFASQNQLNLQINPRSFSQPLGRITSDLADFESALKASNARVLAFGASTAVLGGAVKTFKELANITIEIEKSLTDVNRVLGLSTSGLQKFSSELFTISKQTASSFDDATKAALEFSRQGLNTEETLKRTADALTLVRLTGISSKQAVEDLTSTINGFSKAGLTTAQVVNKLAAVEQDFAVSASDLTEALSRTGQAAQEAGVDFDQLNALVTTAQQSTARGGAVIGNALKTIFTRLQRTDTLDQLEKFNIIVRDVEGNILPAVQILQNFANKYNDLADAQRAQLSEQVAGVYQVNILKGIVNDLTNTQGTYTKALERGAKASNEADLANQKLNKTLSALATQTGLGLQQLANNVGKVTFAPIFEAIVSPVNDAVKYINDTLEGEGPGSIFANGLLKGIRNVITGPGLAIAFAVIAKVAKNTFEDATKALPAILGLTTEAQKRANIEKSILSILQGQSQLSMALQGQQGNEIAQAQTLLNFAKLQTAQYQQQLQLAQQLAPLLSAQGATVGARGIQVGPRIKAGGHIPAFAEMSERMGAAMGGYKAGKVIKAPSSVGSNTYMNTAEQTKYVSGFSQPFINPPARSKAGRAHRQNSISRTGIDPYMFSGFIPNFVNKKNQILLNKEIGRDFENKVGKDIGTPPSFNKAIDFASVPNIPSDPLKEYNKNFYSSQTFADAYSGTGHNAATNIGKIIRHLDLNYQKILNNPYSDNYFFDGKDLILDPNFTEIIGKGADQQIAIASSKASSLSPESKSVFLQGLNKKQQKKALNQKIVMEFAKDKVYGSGFIPNFATPMTTASIPWFKKYSSKYKNAAGDTDLFKMGDFPTYGRGLDHEYAKNGNSAMLSYLHEDFVRSALNIALASKKVIRPADVGFKNKPVSDISNENDFDLLYRIADGSYSMLELKQDFKNVSGSVTGFMNKKLANLEKENPALAKKVSSMIAVSNRPKFTDPTGRNAGANFSEFEMAAASIVKDKYSNVDPSTSAKLTKVTDGLLRRYEAKKNTTYSGFIPNFAYQQAVMSLEEGMSGEKAIFDTKPFPHIRNKSQPTFSSAISDHGGLGNALSDSMRGQKNAGLMNRGFMPNFGTVNPNAAFGVGGLGALTQAETSQFNKLNAALSKLETDTTLTASQMKALKTSIRLEARSLSTSTGVIDIVTETNKALGDSIRKNIAAQRASTSTTVSNNKKNNNSTSGGGQSGFFQSNMLTAMVAPILGSAIASQAAFGDKKRYELTEKERMTQNFANTGVTSISTGAAIGTMLLPGWGTAIGAAVGGLIAFSEATKAAKLTIGELKEKISDTATKQTDLIRAYKTSVENLISVSQSGGDPKAIDSARTDLATSLYGITTSNLKDLIPAEGKSVDLKGLEAAILDVNRKADSQTSALSATEKLSSGGKEVSMMDRIIQSLSETILDFTEDVSHAFGFLGDGIKTIMTSVLKDIPFTKTIDYLNKGFTGFFDYLTSGIERMGLIFTQVTRKLANGMELVAFDVKNLLNPFRNGRDEEQNALFDKQAKSKELDTEFDVAMQKNNVRNAAAKVNMFLGSVGLMTEALGGSGGSETSKAISAMLEKGKNLKDKVVSGMGERKPQNFDMEKIVAEFMNAGGAKSVDFFEKFKGDSQIQDFATRIGSEPSARKRDEEINSMLTYVKNNKVELLEDATSLAGIFRKMSETNEFKGQFILANFLKFVDKLSELRKSSNAVANTIGIGVADFSKIKRNIEEAFIKFNNMTDLKQVGIEGTYERGKIGREEAIKRTESFGKPFDAARQRFESDAFNRQESFRKENVKSDIGLASIASGLTKTTNVGEPLLNLQKLTRDLEDTNIPFESRAQALENFIKNQKNFLNADNEQGLQAIATAKSVANISKEKNKEDIKTANDVYNLEVKRLQEARNFKLQLQAGLSSLNDEGDLMVAKLGRDLPSMFADGMVNGIKAAIKETDNLGDALLGVAASFLDSISTTLMQAGTRKLIGSFGLENLFTAQKGGVVRAQSGMYVSGTGSGDKYPAMLENGEYVLNRRAVMAMGGPASLDTLNFSAAPRFASGGAFNAELSDIKSMEDGMTTFGLENSSLYKELRDAEIQKAEQARQKKRARQAQTAQMVGSIVASIATIGIGAGISNKMGNIQAGKAQTLSAKLNATGGAGMTNSELGSLAKFQKSGLLGNNFEYKGPTNIQSGFNSFLSGPSFGPNRALVTKPMGRQTGGLIGSRLSDTIPGYMEGGLYNSPMVKQYGAGMQSGGTSAVANNSNTVNNSNASNSFNFNTSVNRDGAIQMGADSSTYKQQDVELSNNLNTKIYGAVLDVIREQQRFGGSLAGTRKA